MSRKVIEISEKVQKSLKRALSIFSELSHFSNFTGYSKGEGGKVFHKG
jgi:hypothetical protein